MKISTKTYYGLKAMANLAQKGDISPIVDIAYEENIPAAFLEKIFQILKHKGLLNSLRGSLGGYQLAKLPSEIPISEIFSALGETLETTPCQAESCPNRASCQTVHFWQKLDSSITNTLNSITLEDLIKHESINQFHN